VRPVAAQQAAVPGRRFMVRVEARPSRTLARPILTPDGIPREAIPQVMTVPVDPRRSIDPGKVRPRQREVPARPFPKFAGAARIAARLSAGPLDLIGQARN